MSEKNAFNPYREWLGINKRNPNYFELLQISPGESDSKKISSAAEEALVKVRACRPGDHKEEWSKLIDRIKRAKGILVEPASRKAYISKLKAAIEQAKQATQTKSPQQAKGKTVKQTANTTSRAAKNARSSKPVAKKSTPQEPGSVESSVFVPVESNEAAPPEVPVAKPAAMNPPAVSEENKPSDPPTLPAAKSNNLPPALPPTFEAVADAPKEIPVATPAEVDPMAPVAIPIGGFGVDSSDDEKGSDPSLPEQATLASGASSSQPVGETVSSPAGEQGTTLHAAADPQSPSPLPRESATQRLAYQQSRKKKNPLLLIVLLIVPLAAVGIGGWFARDFFSGGETDQVASNQNGDQNANSSNNSAGQGADSTSTDQSTTGATSTENNVSDQAIDDSQLGENSDSNQNTDEASDGEMTAADDESKDTANQNNVTENPVTENPAMADLTTNDNGSTEPMTSAPLSLNEVVNELVAIRELLARREIEQAKTVFASLTEAETPADAEPKIERMGLVVDLIDRFWQAYFQAAANLEAGEELATDDDRVVVIVEVTDDLIIYRSAGQNQRINLRQIEPGLAKIIAEKGLQDSAIDRRLIIGAFYSIEGSSPQVAVQRAKEAWEEAELMGADVQNLVAFLDDQFDTASIAEMSMGSDRPSLDTLEPVPSKEQLDQLISELNEEFGEEIADAKTPRRRTELVSALNEVATQADLPKKYVYMNELFLYQARSGQLTDAFSTIAELAQTYQIEGEYGLKVKALVAASEVFVGVDFCKEVAESALDLADAALEDGESTDIGLLTRAATNAAEKSHDETFVQQISERVTEIRGKL